MNVTLPAIVENQATVQIRIISANAVGNDETTGVDDIVVTSQPATPNNPPVITSDGGGTTATVSIAENTTAVTTVTATDADNNPIIFSISGGADQALFAIDGNSGVLTFKAAPNFELPGDADTNNSYLVTVRAFDGTDFDTQDITVTVTDAADAPTITSNGGGATATVSVAENQTAVTTVTATDPDSPTIMYTLVGGLDKSRFALDINSGVLTFLVAPDREAPTDSNGDNVYEVTVQASDGSLVDTQAISVTVTDLNDTAPSITSNGAGATAMVSVVENTKAVTTVTAIDPDTTGTLVYSIDGGLDAGRFSIVAATGVLTFLAAPNFEGPTDTNLNNVYEVTVKVTDGTNSDSQAISVTVTDTNEATPVITSNGGGATAAINLLENSMLVTTVTATDADAADTVTFELAGGVDMALFAIDKFTGALTFLTPPNFESPTDKGNDNKYEVSVKASDTIFFDTQDITVTVVNVDEAPAFVGGTSATLIRFENAATVATVVALDPEGKTPLVYGIAGGDDSALFFIDSGTGQLSFFAPPNFEIAGDKNADNNYLVTVSASDGALVGFQAITVNIGNVNEAPTFSVGTGPTVNEDAGAQTVVGFLSAIAVGPTGDLGTKVTFDVTNANNALFTVQPSIDSNGKLTYTPAANANGSAKVTVFATDNGGTDNGGVDTSATQFFTITVNGVNDAPTISILGNQAVNEDSSAKTLTGFVTGTSVGPANETGQTATVTATNDNNSLFSAQPTIDGSGKLSYTPAANANGMATVTVKVQDTGGTSFGGVDISTQTFTITVNSVNDAPTFTVGANQLLNEDAPAQTVPAFLSGIGAGAANESGQTVSFQVSNDNTALFSVQPAIDATGQLTYTLAKDAFGKATVTVVAKDTGGTAFGGTDTSPAQTFSISANAVNDAPTNTALAFVGVSEDRGLYSATFSSLTAGPANESDQKLTITVTNDNPGLFITQPNYDASGLFTFETAPNANGSAIVTLKVQDTGGTAFGGIDTSTQLIGIQINAVNDVPSFAVAAEATTTINTGLNSFAMFATAIAAGPADESGQAVSFVLSNDNTALFDVQPTIDANGTLTFTLAADATGLALVTVFAKDDGGTFTAGDDDTSDSQTFLIRVLDKNVAPSFVVGAPQTVNEDSGAATVTGFLTSIAVGPSIESAQKISFQVSNDNAALFAVQPTIDANGQLKYTPAANAFGSATVTVIAMDDGGTLNGGDDTSDPQTFTITVNAVNDVPSFTVGGKQTVNEDAAAKTVAAFATKISAGPANESVQAVSFLISTDNPSLFASGPAIDATGQLTYTVATNAFGTATVTVTAKDDGGTAFGGVDTSASQTFVIVVNPVNDAPTFTLGGNLNPNEDAGPQFFPILTNLSSGPANESGQTVTLGISSTNPGLFAVAPSLDGSGNLTYTPAANANGTSTVTVTAKDTGGTANGGVDTSTQTFTITVNAVNDDPVFAITSKLAVDEDAGPRSIPGYAFGIAAGPADEAAQPLSFALSTTVTSGDLTFAQAPALDATGTLTFAASPDRFGTATVTVQLSDGNGGTATQAFELTVNPVNDPPTATVNVPVAPLGGIGPQAVPGVLAIGTGANNEPDPLTVSVSVASTAGNIVFTQAPAIDANGTLTYTVARNSIGSAKLAITVSDGTNATAVQFVTVSVDSTGPTEVVGYPEFAVGSDLGLTYVSFHNPDQSERFFSPAFPGTEFGARVAGADFTRDGIADLVLGSGVGRSTLVQVIDGATQKSLFSIVPFESSFTGGVYVAAGDVDGDGIADLVITPDEGGGPRVRVFNGANFKLVADFFGIDDENFRGGARAAFGDLNADGKADLAVAAGFGGGPRVAGFDGQALSTGKAVKLFNDFFAFEQTLRNGVFIAIGDLDGDGVADVIAGGGPGGGPRVTGFDGADLMQSGGAVLNPTVNFFAGNTESRGGIRIAVKDLDGDNKADLIVGSGTDAGSRVTAYLGTALAASADPVASFEFDAFDGFTGGVFVG